VVQQALKAFQLQLAVAGVQEEPLDYYNLTIPGLLLL
jgi:hypothetical protein